MNISMLAPDLTAFARAVMPWSYEMNPDIVKNGIRKILGLNTEDTSIPKPAYRPDFCPGCPHRSSFYTIKRALKLAGKPQTVARLMPEPVEMDAPISSIVSPAEYGSSGK